VLLRGDVLTIDIHVPATLSNLGPGFDVLGFALTLHNTFRVQVVDSPTVFTVSGRRVDPATDLVVHTALRAAEHFGRPLTHGFSLVQDERLPRGRGLGSSATARVAGFLTWCHITGQRPPVDDALAFLSAEEGHPDNAVAAMLGGITASTYDGDRLHTVRWPSAEGWKIVLCIPEIEISTDEARMVLPSGYRRSDVVFNSGRLAMLLHGLMSGDEASLRLGVRDRVHHPYRAPLIGPVDEAISKAEASGAAAAFISGSGSTLAALVGDRSVDLNRVGDALSAPFRAQGVAVRVVIEEPSMEGAWARFLAVQGSAA
jgi:homoserine kinase